MPLKYSILKSFLWIRIQWAGEEVIFYPNATLANGRFTIRRRLGSGGMGIVYEATDNTHHNRIALKVLSEVSPSGIYRLKQEFRSLLDVTHPNLVALHELFAHQNTWFFTMDLVLGNPLHTYLSVHNDPTHLKQIFLDLAEGIGAIHSAGKLHRDLKPNNVLITPQGDVRILDFGLISDETEGGVGQTLLEECTSGTPLYMAPEQTVSTPSTRATDWYAFGIMLFEALTGHRPFEGSTREVFDRKQREAPPRATEITPNIPEDLDQLCWLLLQRTPADRPDYQTIVNILGNNHKKTIVPIQAEAPFIGRKPELDLLFEALESTDGGAPSTVLIDGPSGIGKSMLIEQFLKQVETELGAVILRGRCYERESVPFKACDSLIDDLTHYLRQLSKPLSARLMPRRVTALARIFPVLNRLDVVRETRERFNLPPNPAEMRRCAFLAAKELLARISTQERLILFVDDLQWSDVDGMKMLTSFITPPECPSLLLIGAYRTEDADISDGLALLKQSISASNKGNILEIRLKPFSKEEAVQLAEHVLPKNAVDVAKQIAQEAQGNPFLISELAGFAEKSKKREEMRLNQVISHRLAELSNDAKSLLICIAISGRPVDASLLKTALNKTNIQGALRSLETLKLIRQTGGRVNQVACYHDRIRSTILSIINTETICAWHGKLADALKAEKKPDPIVMTEHLLGAGRIQDVMEYAIKAAQMAQESLAFDNAARFYDIALESKQLSTQNRWEILRDLAESLAHAGRGPEAAEVYMRAAKDAPADASLFLRCQAAQQWINSGHMVKGKTELDQVLRCVGLKLHKTPAQTILFLIKSRLSLRLALSRINKFVVLTNNSPPQPTNRQLLEIRASETAVFGLWATDTLQSAAFCSHYLKRAIQIGMPSEIVKGLCSEAAFRVTEKRGDTQTISQFMAAAENLSQTITDPETHAHLKLARGMMAFTSIDLPNTVSYLEDTEQFCLESCTRKMATLEISQVFLGAAYSRMGQWAKLQKAWDRWIAHAKETGNRHHLAVCRMWLVGTFRWLASDQIEIATAQLRKGEQEWPFSDFNMQRSQALVSKAYILFYQGKYEAAAELYTSLLKNVHQSYMKHMKFARTFYTTDYLCCITALAATSRAPSRIKEIKQLTQKLEKEDTTYTTPYIALFMGAVAYIQGKDEEAVHRLKQTISLFETHSFNLHAAAVKRRLGNLIGGDEGASVFAEGTAFMLSEQIANPDCVTRILAPGFKNEIDH